MLRKFHEFVYNKIDIDHYADFSIEVEECEFNFVEQILLGVDQGTAEQYPKKFRITVTYSKTGAAARQGLIDTETYYVAANNAKEAKSKILQHLTTKRTNKKTGNVAKWFQDQVKNIHFDSAKQVKTWNDLIGMVQYIVDIGFSNPLRFFDQNDLAIYANKKRGHPDFAVLLQSLPKEELVILKKFLKHFIDRPDMAGPASDALNASGRYAKDYTQRELISKNLQNYGSKHAKRALKDVNEEPAVHHLSSLFDIIKEAKRYGFTPKDLDSKVEELYPPHEMETLKDKRDVWKSIYQHLQRYMKQFSMPKKMLPSINWKSKTVSNADDPSSVFWQHRRKLQKKGLDSHAAAFQQADFGLDGTDLMSSYPHLFDVEPSDSGLMGYVNKGDGQNNIEKMWRMYKEGPPKMPTKKEMYYNAFIELIKDCRAGHNCPTTQAVTKPGYDDVPF